MSPPLRLAVYTDFEYHRDEGGGLWGEQAFALFVAALLPWVNGLKVVGRLDPSPHSARHRLPAGLEFAALPHYSSLTGLDDVARGTIGSLRAFWRALDDVDAVWLLGPHPFSIAFAVLAAVRRRRVFLGVRQDMPVYMARRYRTRPLIRLAARALESAYRVLARVFPTIVVGQALARNYSRARRLLTVAVSLVGADQVCDPRDALSRDYAGELTILSVGRLDPEKNPLLAVEILVRLLEKEDRWRLAFCGDGPLQDDLERCVEHLGLADRVDLRGYVPYEQGMRELYRGAHFLLLSSWTEGFPQVAVEAFAAGLPVVSTEVGGLPGTVPDAVTTYPPGASDAGAAELLKLAGDSRERERLVRAGISWVADHTMAAEAERIAAFFRSS